VNGTEPTSVMNDGLQASPAASLGSPAAVWPARQTADDGEPRRSYSGGRERSFLLQRVQPAMVGLIDGSLSTLAPIFTVALATGHSRYALFAGLATALGAGVSMAFSEGLSDPGESTGRGSPYVRGSITGAGTFLGGALHTLPFLIPDVRVALIVAAIVVACELLALSWIRWRFFHTGFARSLVSIMLGGVIIVAISAALGGAAG
jgi:erythrin-vacuolar iron transport family protein